MSDLAFNNYCLTCDKLCSQNSIYCSEECKTVDEFNSTNILSQHNEQQSNSIVSSTEELVSPLLTPSLYQHYSQHQHLDVNNSPLLLSTNNYNQATATKDLDYFDLNYSVKSKTNYAIATNASSSNADLITAAAAIPSTSHNYRKWLTACL
ncbi:uncharacterized protein RJT20DRAFT_125542 [Scheffersomyces xylosifermentans]|uniref:uncharacterized protein n=1 Tax=Scheffersomyces xylosifermentans TaxID=1304137 RepID=UPI00315C626B